MNKKMLGYSILVIVIGIVFWFTPETDIRVSFYRPIPPTNYPYRGLATIIISVGISLILTSLLVMRRKLGRVELDR